MYIPKGKLDPQIYYTKGGEFYLPPTNVIYVGYYHRDLMGGVWTDKEHTVNSLRLVYINKPNLKEEEQLRNINKSKESVEYFQASRAASKTTPNPIQIPKTSGRPPTPEEYQQTYFSRYILQPLLSSKPVFIEVNKEVYYSIERYEEDNFYKKVEVLWKIYGPTYDKKENGVTMQGGVIDSNLRSIQEAEKIIPGISAYLNDLTLYAIITD